MSVAYIVLSSKEAKSYIILKELLVFSCLAKNIQIPISAIGTTVCGTNKINYSHRPCVKL